MNIDEGAPDQGPQARVYGRVVPRVERVFDDPRGDMCVGFFQDMWNEGRVTFPLGARVLEVGCAEADWLTPMKTARPDLHLTGMDQRPHRPRRGADVLVQGDLLDAMTFPPSSFNGIVAVSVIEHVGIGRYGDLVDADGDTHAMAHLKQWLRPDGVLYLDVPFRPVGPSTPFRQYNEADLQRRVIAGWREVDRQHFDSDHPDGPYVALVLTPL